MRKIGAWAALLLVLATPAWPQAPGPDGDEGTRRLIALGLDNFERLRCADERPCAPATEAERANPPLSVGEARSIIRRGVISGAAAHCELDWQRRNFLPMMAYWRKTKRKSERQMALVGFLHGISQARGAKMLAGSPCSETARRNLDPQLDFRP